MEFLCAIAAIIVGVLIRLAIRSAIDGTINAAKRVVTGETRSEKEIRRQEEEEQRALLEKIKATYESYKFDKTLSDDVAEAFARYVPYAELFGKMAKYPPMCLYKGKLENVDFYYDGESVVMAKNITMIVKAYSSMIPYEQHKFAVEMFLYYLVMYIKILKGEFNGGVTESEAADYAGLYAYSAGMIDNKDICEKVAAMCTPEILAPLSKVYKTGTNGSEIKNALARHISVAKPENVRMVFEELDDDFKKELEKNVKSDKSAISEVILKNTLCGYDIPEKMLPLLITEDNAVFSADPDVVLEYYTKYYTGKTTYNDFCFNAPFEKPAEDFKCMETKNIRLYKRSQKECVIDRRADIDFANAEKYGDVFELAAKYENIIVAVPKNVAAKENMAVDDFVSHLVINHKKLDSKNKSPQTLKIITDGEIAANTIAKIEDNFKKYEIVKGA